MGLSSSSAINYAASHVVGSTFAIRHNNVVWKDGSIQDVQVISGHLTQENIANTTLSPNIMYKCAERQPMIDALCSSLMPFLL
jgi:hypothetical protein